MSLHPHSHGRSVSPRKPGLAFLDPFLSTTRELPPKVPSALVTWHSHLQVFIFSFSRQHSEVQYSKVYVTSLPPLVLPFNPFVCFFFFLSHTISSPVFAGVLRLFYTFFFFSPPLFPPSLSLLSPLPLNCKKWLFPFRQAPPGECFNEHSLGRGFCPWCMAEYFLFCRFSYNPCFFFQFRYVSL